MSFSRRRIVVMRVPISSVNSSVSWIVGFGMVHRVSSRMLV